MNRPYIISLQPINDTRGSLFESYKSTFHGHNEFVVHQENTCVSHKNVFRGMHYQKVPQAQAKLVTVLNGEIDDVCVNIDTKEVFTFRLKASVPQLLYIPNNFAHGYRSLYDNTIVCYKMDKEYHPESTTGFHVNSIRTSLEWCPDHCIMSEKDATLPLL